MMSRLSLLLLLLLLLQDDVCRPRPLLLPACRLRSCVRLLLRPPAFTRRRLQDTVCRPHPLAICELLSLDQYQRLQLLWWQG